MQSVFSDGALSLHTRSLKYGKVCYENAHDTFSIFSIFILQHVNCVFMIFK